MPVVGSDRPSIPGRASTTSFAGSGIGECLTYDNIRSNGLGDLGQFRTMKGSFGWRIRKPVTGVDPSTRKTTQLDGGDVESASWTCIGGREYGMKVVMKDNKIFRFDGFKATDYDTLRKHIKQHWGVDLEKSKMSSRGWHWGLGKISGGCFTFDVDNRDAFDIPKDRVSQVSVVKGDITLVLDNDENRCDAEDQLLELRLFVPPSKIGVEGNEDSLLEAFKSLPGSTSVPLLLTICTFSDIKVLVPAGRFDVQVTRKTVKLQGKSNDFTIDYRAITEMYLLHAAPSPHVNLVLHLASPLRKGHTPYFNVVIQFDDKKTVDVELGLTEDEIAAIRATHASSKLQAPLTARMEGPEYDVAARVLTALVGKEPITSKTFKSSSGQPFFRSSYKADSGTFYPLEHSFVFIPKPVMIIKYDDVVSVSFGRTSGSQTKLFEFDVVVKGGQTYSFSSVDRQESGPFIEFLQRKDLRVRSFRPDGEVEAGRGSISDQELPSEDESDDEDFDEDASDDDDDDEDYDSEADSSLASEEEEGDDQDETAKSDAPKGKAGGSKRKSTNTTADNRIKKRKP